MIQETYVQFTVHAIAYTAICIVFCILEAIHDSVVIELQDYRHPDYKALSKKWHKMSFWYVALVGAALSYTSGHWYLIASLVCARLSVFPVLLNSLSGKDPLHLSDNGIDGIIKRSIGMEWMLRITLLGLFVIPIVYYQLSRYIG